MRPSNISRLRRLSRRRAATPHPRGPPEESGMNTTPEPLPTRPAATVMLVRDVPGGLKIFLMRRHSKMEFAPGVIVFPGGGVDDRDRKADIAWAGPPPDWWAQRFGIETELAAALVCAA